MNNLTTPADSLLALLHVESVGDTPPFRIVPLVHQYGAMQSADELMAAKVKWVNKAGYRVLSKSVPLEFLPYNALIRVDENGTEDRNLDYLAHIAPVSGGTAPD